MAILKKPEKAWMSHCKQSHPFRSRSIRVCSIAAPIEATTLVVADIPARCHRKISSHA